MEFQKRYGLYREMAEEYLRGLFTVGQPYGRLQEAMGYSLLAGASESGRYWRWRSAKPWAGSRRPRCPWAAPWSLCILIH